MATLHANIMISGSSGPDATEELRSLIATLDADAQGFTICEVGAGIRLKGAAFDGVGAFLVLSGVMCLALPHGEVRIVKAGELAMLPAGVQIDCSAGTEPGAIAVDGRSRLTRRGPWLVSDAHGGGSADLVVAAARISGTARSSLSGPIVARVGGLPEGRHALAMLRAEVARAEPGCGSLAVQIMSACVVIGLRAALRNGPDVDPAAKANWTSGLERAVALIRARPADPHDLGTLAEAAGMSRATFVRRFRAQLNTTPAAFLAEVRLAEAVRLLRSTDLPVKSVAAQAGFTDRSHFSRAFRRAFDLDPKSYRAAIRDAAAQTGDMTAQMGAP